jgi:hypothetical protein
MIIDSYLSTEQPDQSYFSQVDAVGPSAPIFFLDTTIGRHSTPYVDVSYTYHYGTVMTRLLLLVPERYVRSRVVDRIPTSKKNRRIRTTLAIDQLSTY